MTRWEYLSLSMEAGNPWLGTVSHDQLDDLLNGFGEQGWELVSGFDTSSLRAGSTARVVLLLKRPLPEGRRALSSAEKQALLRAEREAWDRRNRYANGELIGELPPCRSCRMPAQPGARSCAYCGAANPAGAA
jgi:hypothetical protein